MSLGSRNWKQHVDTLIVVPKQNFFPSLINVLASAMPSGWWMTLYNATRGIAEIITGHGVVNVDADVRTVMKDMGEALMGTGIASGEYRNRGRTKRYLIAVAGRHLHLRCRRG